MKARLIILSLLLVSLFSCLKDEGVYNYEREIEPTLANGETSLTVYCYGGDTVRTVVEFETLGRDSLEEDWTYEWKLWDSVLCTEKNLNMPSDSIFEKINITSFPEDGQSVPGIFSIRNVHSGEVYQFSVDFYMRPKYWNGSWVILSENGADSKLTYLEAKKDNLTGEVKYDWEDDIYQKINGTTLTGKPLRLITHNAPNISSSVGATFVITEGTMVELNNETFMAAAGVEDLFAEGVPAGFQAKDLVCLDLYNYMTDQEGRVYKRTFTANYLGGKYISEPYQIDEKDLRISYWGEGPDVMTVNYLPAWDEANRRVVVLSNSQTRNLYAVRDNAGGEISIANMPEGTKVLFMLYDDAIYGEDPFYPSGRGYHMIYNDAEGKTWLCYFALADDYDGKPVCTMVEVNPFPGGNVDENTLFIGTSDIWAPNARIFYTKGNEIRFADRRFLTDRSYKSFDHEITSMIYAGYADYANGLNPFEQIAIGFDNGDFVLLDITNWDKPQEIEAAKGNVGGKVVSIAQIGVNTHIITN